MSPNAEHERAIQAVPLRVWLRLGLVYVSLPLTLFVCAGDTNWWQAWVFAMLIVTAGLGGRMWAERRHPGLMAERLQTVYSKTPGIKSWDKVLAPLMALTLSFPLLIVAGLDHRFGGSPPFPAWLHVTGFLLIGCGYGVAAWAIAENRFFSSMTRIQTDRGHVVCDTGPYRLVRHPGYAGNLLALPGLVLALNSLWMIVPVAAALAVAVIRSLLEDRTLQDELPGYRDYSSRVRYRLMPGVF